MGKALKITLIAVGSIILLTGAALIAGQSWLKGEIGKVIGKESFEIDGTDYRVSAGAVSVKLFRRGVILEDVKLHPADGAENAELGVTAKRISLSGISYRKGRGERKQSAGAKRLVIESPHLVMTRNGNSKQKKENKRPLEETVTEKFDMISVSKIEVNDCSAEITVQKEHERQIYTLSGITLTSEDFRIGGDTIGHERVFFSERLKAGAGKFSYLYKREALLMEIEGIEADSRAGSMSIGSFKITPQFGMLEYARKVFDHTDWTQVDLGDIEAFGFDFVKLARGEGIVADSLHISHGLVDSYKDRNVPHNKVIPLLYQSVQKIGMPLDIPSVLAEGLAVYYKELAPGADTPGAVSLTDMTGAIEGLTNIAASAEQTYRLDVTGDFMGSTRISASMILPVSSDYDHWQFNARAANMDMTIVNPIVEPLANIKISSGNLHSVDFHVTANSMTSASTLAMTYDGLHIEILRKNDLDRKRGFITFLADTLVVRHANPGAGGRLRTGEGEAERDIHRSQFNFIVKSLMASAKKVVI